MLLTCPSCGAQASLEAWQNDATCRYFLAALVQLPAPVLRQVLPYLGLFRKHGKALPWAKALIIIRGLQELVQEKTVHWQGGETRPATADLWGQAMEATIAAKPKELKNHNYLRNVAWEKAAELAAKQETDREKRRQIRRLEKEDGPAPMSEATRQAVDALHKKWGEE